MEVIVTILRRFGYNPFRGRIRPTYIGVMNEIDVFLRVAGIFMAENQITVNGCEKKTSTSKGPITSI